MKVSRIAQLLAVLFLFGGLELREPLPDRADVPFELADGSIRIEVLAQDGVQAVFVHGMGG